MESLEYLPHSHLNHYQVLGVDADASRDQIRSAYKEALLATHPDKTRTDDNNRITQLKEAYRVLCDPQLREKYDTAVDKSIQREGFTINGDGLDVYDLSDFVETETGWTKDCPRCTLENGVEVSESDLENGTADGMGGYDIIAQCSGCSLWIQIRYAESE